ncbi:hypothetical protein KKG46_03615 [Patescibacteria group bacterium]|nr:hypothetical protein [Patescibacteria group bacterium]
MNKLLQLIAVLFVSLYCFPSAHAGGNGAQSTWRVQMGTRAFTPRCDEIGDLVIGGTDNKTPIYSCRNGEHWQAVKGNQVLTPRCAEMSYIWWSVENSAVMYTCTDGAVFVGNQPQSEDGPWSMVYALSDGSYCGSYLAQYRSDCRLRLAHKDYRGKAIKPRRFPDVAMLEGVVELSFDWAPPAPATPKPKDADVEVAHHSSGGPVDEIRFTPRGTSRFDHPAHPDGMPSADPTKMPSGKPAAVSCGDEVVTSYLGEADQAIWIKYDDGKRRVCVGKSLGKSWDEIWDLEKYTDGTASYFARSGGNWRLVNGTREALAFDNIRWHHWVTVNGTEKRAYIATDKVGETTPAVYLMLDAQQLVRATKAIKMLRFIPSAGTFVLAVQD